MKNQIKIVSVLLVSIIIIPQIALASWWNPFSWNIFKSLFSKPQIEIPIVEQKELSQEEKTPIIQENINREENTIVENKDINKVVPNKSDIPQNKTEVVTEVTKDEVKPIVTTPSENIFVSNAITAYEKELNIFNKAYETYINDYKNSFSKNGNISVATDKTIWTKFNDSLSRLKSKWSEFKDEIYSSQEDKLKRAEIMAKYVQPSVNNYTKIVEIHNSVPSEVVPYTLKQLSETLNYDAFFSAYGISYGGSLFSSEIRSGLSTAMSYKYKTDIECLALGGRYEISGCKAYIKAISYDDKIAKLKTLLE